MIAHVAHAGCIVITLYQGNKKNPSPFITETATKIFSSVDEALEYFEAQGMFATRNLFGH